MVEMNRVAVSVTEEPPPAWCAALSAYSQKALDEMGKDRWDLSILLCDDQTISALNAQYRNKPEATDVLSFELGVEESCQGIGEGAVGVADGDARYLPGDIVISLDTLRENAQYFNTSEDEELRRLLIHGILHLDGMDHETNGNAEPMLVLQEKILKKLAGERILPEGESLPRRKK
jgi:probable rRNA maturation factor